MPIISYLAYPEPGKLNALQHQLSQHPECEIIPAKNRELLILVTITANQGEEEKLQKELKKITNLQCLTMVSGFTDPSKSVSLTNHNY